MITEEQKEIIANIVHRVVGSGARFFVFGSRARREVRRGSDIDIAVERLDGKPLSPGILTELKDAFDDSFLVERVDVVDLARASEKFKVSVREAIVEV